MTINSATLKKFQKSHYAIGLTLLTTLVLAACGGGDSASLTAPTLDLNAAQKAYVTGGFSQSGAISGYCKGTKIQNFSPTAPGRNLAGLPALISEETETDRLVNPTRFCSAFYNSNAGQPDGIEKIYWDPSTIGLMTDGSSPPNYVYSNLQAFPSAVTVGSKGTASTYINYFGQDQALTKGALTWSIAADTPTTLLWITVDTARLISSGKLAYTSTTKYRLNADNTVTALFKTIKAYSGFTQGAGDISITEKYR
jgi:hypothetical protein